MLIENRLQDPLTPDNLESLSFSVPGLRLRLDNTVAGVTLVHSGHVQVSKLSSALVGTPDRDNERACVPPLACFPMSEDSCQSVSTGAEDEARRAVSAPEGCLFSNTPQGGAPSEDSPASTSTGSDDFYSCSSQDSFPSTHSTCWESAVCSPNLRGTTQTEGGHHDEVISVDFKGGRYIRVLSRVGATDFDVEATWIATDFTEHGELVFSVRLDLTQPHPLIPQWMEEKPYW